MLQVYAKNFSQMGWRTVFVGESDVLFVSRWLVNPGIIVIFRWVFEQKQENHTQSQTKLMA
ncbi:MAG: hypothetical protein ACI9FJ_002087 [Alteromonadaceae bacterium]|jgi:hypothetical protein